MKRLALAIATVGGAGYVPVAPGTVGSAVGVAIYFLTWHWSKSAQFALVVGISAIGVWASGVAAAHFKKEDPGYVVIDEVAGQLLTLLHSNVGLIGATAGFVLFRTFDIIKPWPARRFEDLPGGVGIMADDLMAGAYGWLVLQGLLFAASAWR
jgi:phosphatidylglycerophosphatase A